MSKENESPFTVFCTDANRETTHVNTIMAKDHQQAMRRGRHECAHDWNCTIDDVIVLGVGEGSMPVLDWNDEGIELDYTDEDKLEVLETIRALLDGAEWTPDLMDGVAAQLRSVGLTVGDFNDE